MRPCLQCTGVPVKTGFVLRVFRFRDILQSEDTHLLGIQRRSETVLPNWLLEPFRQRADKKAGQSLSHLCLTRPSHICLLQLDPFSQKRGRLFAEFVHFSSSKGKRVSCLSASLWLLHPLAGPSCNFFASPLWFSKA